MFKPELIRNKLYALLLIACTLPVMFLEGDATATVFISMIAVPMFFAKENWILGGYHESQESGQQDIRRRDVRCREKAMDLEIQRQLAEYDRKHLVEIDAMILWVLHERFGFGPKRLRQYYDSFRACTNELVERYQMDAGDDIWLCTQMLKRIGVDVEQWHKETG